MNEQKPVKTKPTCIGAILLSEKEFLDNQDIIPPVPDGTQNYQRESWIEVDGTKGSADHLVSVDYKDHWWLRSVRYGEGVEPSGPMVASVSGRVPYVSTHGLSKGRYKAHNGTSVRDDGKQRHYIRPALLCDLSGYGIKPGEVFAIHKEPYIMLRTTHGVNGKTYSMALRLDVIDYGLTQKEQIVESGHDSYNCGSHKFDGFSYEQSAVRGVVDSWFQKEFKREYRRELKKLPKEYSEQEKKEHKKGKGYGED